VAQVVQVGSGSGARMSPCQRYPDSGESSVTSRVGKGGGWVFGYGEFFSNLLKEVEHILTIFLYIYFHK